MSQTIICQNCKTEIDLDKIAEEKFKYKLEEQKVSLEKEQEKQRLIFEKELEEKTIDMRKKAQEFAEKKANEERKKVELEMKDMTERLNQAEKEQQEAKKKELEYMKKQRELEDKEKNMDFEMEKKLFEERKKIESSIEEKLKESSKKEMDERLASIQEDFRKKELEYQKQQEQLKKSLDDAKRKAEQGSQQIQWDIQENDLKNILQMAFPIDRIDDVATWIKWADIMQIVRNNIWQEAWTIIWESKNTKAWSDSWVSKLKDDKIRAKANIAIIITTVLPKDIKNFWIVWDVFVTLPEYSLQIATIMRDKILSISKVEKSLEWKDAKMEMLYKYLTSEEFWWKINSIVDAFQKLKEDLDTEKRAMERIWKRREKELERVIISTSMMYWDFEWMIGQTLPWWEKLALWWWDFEDDEV